ncbi:hypothetical protein [Phenylobacterium sp. SCN 70-31]|uniref:hypothetical protein n=1 Tax=Phenylobacterium sp. SCN 70-31 TaxID=1660129 RepID=UPI00086B9BA4|nr:hypothetical protein [Phenylobacterium sp. SCN 70-31]ODT87797.1 MAG: hypothetical protein ABS78_10565 [Phenylobacterium sp. SCN 70-31]
MTPPADRGAGRRIDFDRVGAAARRSGEAVAAAFLPDGRREGREWVARNPKRPDKTLGSFKVNLDTGKWADFASGDRGGDLVGLVAFLLDLSQRDAAVRLAEALGVDPYE